MAWDKVWESIFSQKEWGKYPAEELIRFIARNFYAKNRQSIKILELGCGPGGNLWYMAREGFQVFGLDGSKTAVDSAIKRLNTEVPDWSGNIQIVDFSKKIPFGDEEFDAVIDNEAVCCNDYQSALDIYSEVSRVLKLGGKIFSRTFTDRCVGYGKGKKLGYNSYSVDYGVLKGLGYTRFTSRADIDRLFEQFKIESIDIVSRSYDGYTEESVEEWIIVAEK